MTTYKTGQKFRFGSKGAAQAFIPTLDVTLAVIFKAPNRDWVVKVVIA